MKTFKLLALLFLGLSVSLVSCSKDDDDDGDETFFECEIDGTEFRATGIEAYAVDFSGDDYSVYGLDLDDDFSMYINLLESAGEGTFQMGDLNGEISAYVVYNGSDPSYSTINNMGTGEVTISKMDFPLVEGTFSFTATNFDDPTDMIEVTEGQFRVEVR